MWSLSTQVEGQKRDALLTCVQISTRLLSYSHHDLTCHLTHPPNLDSAIICVPNIRRMLWVVCGPAITCLFEAVRRSSNATDLVLELKKLHTHTLVGMPGNVAVHQPGTWVVDDESHNKPASSRQHCCITSGGLFIVQRAASRGGEVPYSGTEDEEVVAVEMDGMRDADADGCARHLLYDPVDPLSSSQ